MPIYLAGAKVIGFFAYGPTIEASLNITLISWETAAISGSISTPVRHRIAMSCSGARGSASARSSPSATTPGHRHQAD
jgi:hypothetical protein